MPKVSKFLWLPSAEEIKVKLAKSMRSFKNLNHPICYSSGAEHVFKIYKELNSDISTYEGNIFNNWSIKTKKKKEEELEIPLIIRCQESGTIEVNFSSGTLTLLNEVKHFKKEFPKWEIPQNANSIFRRFEELRLYNNSLDKITTLYNFLKIETNEKEYKLFEREIQMIDRVLTRAEKDMTWNSDDITEYLEKVLEMISELHERVCRAKHNVTEIVKLVSTWKNIPLFVRNSNTQERSLLDLKKKEDLKKSRYNGMKEAASKIVALVDENEHLFEVDLDDEQIRKSWNIYLRHIDVQK